MAGKFRIPQTTTFVTLDPVTKFFVQSTVRRYTIPFVALTSGFSWMSAAAHFSVLLGFKHYIADLRCGVNQFRWWEYAASSSLLIVLIAMLVGVWDILSLLTLGSVNAAMNLFGLWMELANRDRGNKKPTWLPYWIAWFFGIVPWIVIFSYLGSWDSSRVPGFVYAIFGVYLVLFCTFPANMTLQYKRIGPWAARYWGGAGHSGYYTGEVVYQWLSLIAKSLLLWLVVGGSNSPNEFSGRTAN